MFQVLADWGAIDNRFNEVRIYDFRPVQPTGPAERTLVRNQSFIATFPFPQGTEPTGTGIKYSIDYSGEETETVTVDPGFVLKP